MKSLILGIFALTIALLITQYFRDDLVFHRNAIELGQWWLVLSGNFVHSNYPHLFLNLTGLWIFGLVFFDNLPLKTFIISTLFLSTSVGIGLYIFNPELQKYYGFSGVLYGLFLVGATTSILAKDWLTGITVALLIIGKIIWDLIYGGSSSSAELIGVPIAVHAHLYGAIGALFISIGLYLTHLRRD
ncbi:MAG: rhombosortase [Thiotrichaceae bacterium]|nr:rhombosortase [Thiotrichaceae bacterium]